MTTQKKAQALLLNQSRIFYYPKGFIYQPKAATLVNDSGHEVFVYLSTDCKEKRKIEFLEFGTNKQKKITIMACEERLLKNKESVRFDWYDVIGTFNVLYQYEGGVRHTYPRLYQLNVSGFHETCHFDPYSIRSTNGFWIATWQTDKEDAEYRQIIKTFIPSGSPITKRIPYRDPDDLEVSSENATILHIAILQANVYGVGVY